MVRSRWLDVDDDAVKASLLVDDDKFVVVKDAILDTLDVERHNDESHLDAYLRTMCEENGLPFTKPVHPSIARAILDNPSIARMIFVLS